MDIKTAKRIGSTGTSIAVVTALLIAYLMVASITGDSWWLSSEGRNLPNFIGGIVFVILAGIFIGRYTGVSILVRLKNAYWVSIRNSFFILWLGTFFTSCIGFFQEGIHDSFGLVSGADNYIVKPLAMVTIFGAIPTIIIAVILGWSIKKSNAGKENK